MTDTELLEAAVPAATVWTGPDAPRQIDALAVADRPDVAGWAASMDQETRRGLVGRTLTQLVMGEPARVEEDRGEWIRVVAPAQSSSADPRGYPGWVRRAHLAAPVQRAEAPRVVVVSRSATCELEAGGSLELSFGTALRVDTVSDGAVTVLLPGHGRGTLRTSYVRLVAEGPRSSADEVLGAARQFLGLGYLWGGTCAWGLDCSGLVHLTFRALGVDIPRDAFDQAAAANVGPVPLDAVRPGDLYFFARPGERVYHVGLASMPVDGDGTRWMLHAPEGGGLVEDAPLAPHRESTLVSAGRVCAPDEGE